MIKVYAARPSWYDAGVGALLLLVYGLFVVVIWCVLLAAWLLVAGAIGAVLLGVPLFMGLRGIGRRLLYKSH